MTHATPSAEPAAWADRERPAAGLRRFLVPAALFLLALLALAVDHPLSQWVVDHHLGAVRRLLDSCEPFGHGSGVVILLVVLYQLDPANRRFLLRVIACSFGAGLVANILKMLVERIRPYAFQFDGTSVWDTFAGWLPLVGPSSRQSFPSGHTATAFGLAWALAWLYPRGRRLFVALAALVACQRIACGAHYLSDTLAGAAVGMAWATLCLEVGTMRRWFDRRDGGRADGV